MQRMNKRRAPFKGVNIIPLPADDATVIAGRSGQVGRSTEGDEATRGDGERAHEEIEEKAKPAESPKEEDLFYSEDDIPNTT